MEILKGGTPSQNAHPHHDLLTSAAGQVSRLGRFIVLITS